jgi:CDP-diacylglycerol--serine O-phosphatidyltransferase
LTVVDPDTQAGWVPEADEADDEEEMPLSLRLSIADTLTLGNATCGFMAVYFTTTGILIPHLQGSQETGMARHSAATAVILMLCAAVFDLFDGLVARKLRSSPWARSWTTCPT